jgi:hypothetical protein
MLLLSGLFVHVIGEPAPEVGEIGVRDEITAPNHGFPATVNDRPWLKLVPRTYFRLT